MDIACFPVRHPYFLLTDRYSTSCAKRCTPFSVWPTHSRSPKITALFRHRGKKLSPPKTHARDKFTRFFGFYLRPKQSKSRFLSAPGHNTRNNEKSDWQNWTPADNEKLCQNHAD